MRRFLSDLAQSQPARFGLLLGTGLAVIAGLLWATRNGSRSRPTQPLPWAGALMAVCGLAVMWRHTEVPVGLVVGVVLLTAGAVIGRRVWEVMIAGVPGAASIVYWAEVGRFSPNPLLVIAIAVAAGLVVDFDRHFRTSAAGPPFMFVSMVGMLITVPDTELAMGLAAMALPLGLAGWPLRALSLGPGAAGVVGLMGYVAGLAGSSRPGAAVGVICALGLMLAEPIGRRIRHHRRSALGDLADGGLRGVFFLGSIHALLVLGMTRFAGLRRDLVTAAMFAVPFLLVGAILGAAPGRNPAEAGTDGGSVAGADGVAAGPS
ncbi:MAG: hypothetical protein ACR2JP_02680 [Acidimicrobiia bacterium]